MSDRAARIAEHELGWHERPEIQCSRCGFTPVLTGDRHTDGGTMIQHMEDAHTPHLVSEPDAAAEVGKQGGRHPMSDRDEKLQIAESLRDGAPFQDAIPQADLIAAADLIEKMVVECDRTPECQSSIHAKSCWRRRAPQGHFCVHPTGHHQCDCRATDHHEYGKATTDV